MVTFVCWVAVVSLSAAFFLALASKWGVLEWLQIHALNDLLHEMSMCHFCTSWWTCVAESLMLCAITGYIPLLAVPFCATMITVKLW